MIRRGSIVALLLLTACGGAPEASPTHPTPQVPTTATPTNGDSLGAKPGVAAAPPFAPPTPVVYKRAGGPEVWLVERHSLPIVSIEIVVRAGAAQDPTGKGGLAVVTANMLDEGAGTRGPLDIARDVDRLGATLHTGAYADYSFVQLTSLKKNLAEASLIMGDVLTKPAMSPVEWKRVHSLWQNDLQQRKSEPNAVSGVVVARQLFPANDPYAHPSDGTIASAGSVTLADVQAFYESSWGPENATVVVVGDISRGELDPLLDKALASWKSRAKPRTRVSPVREDSAKAERRVIIVDRPDAPQSVIAVARRGVAAEDPVAPLVSRLNIALGGSFTSRLNQDLREEHGWSYGARSRFTFSTWRGAFVAQAAVQTDHAGDALKAMLADVATFSEKGLTDEEVDKTRMVARADLLEAYERVEQAAHRIARNAGVGLGAGYEAQSSARVYAATRAELDSASKAQFDVANGLVVVVGPRAKLEPQLKAIGITKFEMASPEGDPVR